MRFAIQCALAFALVGTISCSSKKKVESAEATQAKTNTIKADVVAADGVLGDVTFTEVPEGVKVTFMVRNLPKGATLASHIHENGVCAAPDFKSAGSHYNPKNKKHGAPNSKEHHLGDLGNFEVDKNGVLKAEKVFTHISVDPASENFIGKRALIIHQQKDKFTQPTGDAGGRLGCAVL